MANVQLIDLTKHYPGFIALNSLNLDVDRGELVALLEFQDAAKLPRCG